MALTKDQRQQLSARLGAPAITEMSGATSSDLYLLEYPDQRQVLRVFRAERWETPTDELSQKEIRILEAVANATLATPDPIQTFMENGVIMSWLPGAVVLPERPTEHWLGELANTLAEIHQHPVQVPFTYESWNDTIPAERPEWWADRALWDAAQALAETAPVHDPIFIHRDYHPVNVLWQGGQISGVVDWINACMGPADVDVAHCRGNLAVMYGLETADAFLTAYQRAVPGYEHDHYWDLDDALSALPDVKPYAPWAEFGLKGLSTDLVRRRLLAFIGAAVQSR
jgi:Ser/Thr protein kinase RdoA (MazF antagonist)